MSDRSSKKDEPTGRRGFFRQMFLSAVEGAEELGKQFAERSRFPYQEFFEEERPPRYEPAPYDPLDHPGVEVHGPPWPPAFGPPIPMHIRRELRERSRRGPIAGAVPRSGPGADPELDPHDVHDEAEADPHASAPSARREAETDLPEFTD